MAGSEWYLKNRRQIPHNTFGFLILFEYAEKGRAKKDLEATIKVRFDDC